MTCPLRSTGITPLHHYYGAVRPYPAHRYFWPRGCSHLNLSLASPCRFSRSIQEPGRESRHLHAGCRLSSLRHPSSLSRRMGQPSVLTPSKKISTLLQQFAYARLSRPCLTGSCPDFSATFTTLACMRFSLSDVFRSAISLSCFLDRFLCSIWNPVSSPRPAVLQSRRAQELSRLAVAPTFPRPLPLPGHTLTALSTAAHSMRSG